MSQFVYIINLYMKFTSLSLSPHSDTPHHVLWYVELT